MLLKCLGEASYKKSEKHFGYPKRYPKTHFRNTDFRYPKNFAFLAFKHIAWQVFTSERSIDDPMNAYCYRRSAVIDCLRSGNYYGPTCQLVNN